jgi:lambda family phage portal protein
VKWLANTCDAFVNAVSPERGNRRKVARLRRELSDNLEGKTRERMARIAERGLSAGGHQSAEDSRDGASWLTSKLSVDSALEADRPTMIERVDSAVKNFEIAANHVEGRAIRVAGSGMTVEPEIGLEEDGEISLETAKLNTTLRLNWERTCERIGRNGEELWEVQQSMARDFERRGEWFLLVGDEYDPLAPTTLKVEIIDPDRVNTPAGKAGDKSVRMGIQLNAAGRAVGCYIQDSHPGDTLEYKQTHTYYPFYLKNGMPRVIHHFARVWDGQHRGFPMMQVGTKRLKNAEEYGEAELERNNIGACMAAFVRSDSEILAEMEAAGVVTDSDGKRVRSIAPGMIQYLGPADEVTFSNPKGPDASFAPYMEHQGRAFASGCNTAYELLSGNWMGLSYSAARVIWNIEDATTAILQLGHEKTVKWLYRHYVTRAINVGLIDVDPIDYRSDPWTYWASRVVYPPKASIDPPAEDRNEMVKIEGCMMPASEMVERINGKPARQVYAAIKRDRKLREEFDLEVHMPQMGRDQELMPESTTSGPTQPGDKNPKSSDANKDRQAVGA